MTITVHKFEATVVLIEEGAQPFSFLRFFSTINSCGIEHCALGYALLLCILPRLERLALHTVFVGDTLPFAGRAVFTKLATVSSFKTFVTFALVALTDALT